MNRKHYPCNEEQIDALFNLSLFRQSTSTCFGHICGSSYIYTHTYVHTKQVPIVVYVQYTSCATNIPEMCRG